MVKTLITMRRKKTKNEHPLQRCRGKGVGVNLVHPRSTRRVGAGFSLSGH